ncbi:MAG: hypothetical protein ACREMU_14235, partial [Gemmatimonadaceae bacterium]
QLGTVIFVLLAIGALLVALGWRGAARGVPEGNPRTTLVAFLSIVVVGVTIVALIFSSLTIEIRDGMLGWHFTGNLVRGSVALRDIESVTQVRDPAIYGWGIRRTMRGTLYRVSGLNAVHIRTRSGRDFSLGSDEPERLLQAIEAARGRASAP